MAERQAIFSAKNLQVGDRIGPFVLSKKEIRNNKPYWIVNCSKCGGTRTIRDDGLKKYVGREWCDCPLSVRLRLGDTFGTYRLVSVARVGKYIYWLCRCEECGKDRTIRDQHLNRYAGRKCMCERPHVRHGHSRLREFAIWSKMLARCYRVENDNYRWYGGVGHYVCQRWRDSFESFLADMGQAPSRKHTLDRIDTLGSYTCGKCGECQEKQQPFNCRWATKDVQVRNAKNNLWFTHNGETLILKDWARKLGLNYLKLYHRLYRDKLTFDQAIISDNRNVKLLTHNGETKSMSEWADSVGISIGALSNRLKRGWTIERALYHPLRHTN